MQLNPPAPTQKPTATFTGEVLMTPLATGEAPSRLSVALVRFTLGARTHWHVHPLGQILHVTEGIAPVCTRDGSVVQARAGDSIVCSPGEEHWHGAPPTPSPRTWPSRKPPRTATAAPAPSPGWKP